MTLSTIDDEVIGEVTIDDEEVQEITMDGDIVWTAEADPAWAFVLQLQDSVAVEPENGTIQDSLVALTDGQGDIVVWDVGNPDGTGWDRVDDFETPGNTRSEGIHISYDESFAAFVRNDGGIALNIIDMSDFSWDEHGDGGWQRPDQMRISPISQHIGVAMNTDGWRIFDDEGNVINHQDERIAFDIDWHPDETFIAVADEDHNGTRIYEVDPYSHVTDLMDGNRDDVINSVSFSRDGQYIATGRDDGQLAIHKVGDSSGSGWDLVTTINVSTGFTRGALKFSRTDRWLAGGHGQTCDIWNFGEPDGTGWDSEETFDFGTNDVRQVDWSTGDDYLVVSEFDEGLNVYQVLA